MPDDPLRFSADRDEMDRARIHGWLSQEAYWALGRSREVQDAAIDGSLNFGVFDDAHRQLAYARVITDGATFAWLCDVFVAEESRARGVGATLIEGVLAALEPMGLRRILLATADAHGLYSRFGFAALAEPDRWMAREAGAAPTGTD